MSSPLDSFLLSDSGDLTSYIHQSNTAPNYRQQQQQQYQPQHQHQLPFQQQQYQQQPHFQQQNAPLGSYGTNQELQCPNNNNVGPVKPLTTLFDESDREWLNNGSYAAVADHMAAATVTATTNGRIRDAGGRDDNDGVRGGRAVGNQQQQQVGAQVAFQHQQQQQQVQASREGGSAGGNDNAMTAANMINNTTAASPSSPSGDATARTTVPTATSANHQASPPASTLSQSSSAQQQQQQDPSLPTLDMNAIRNASASETPWTPSPSKQQQSHHHHSDSSSSQLLQKLKVNFQSFHVNEQIMKLLLEKSRLQIRRQQQKKRESQSPSSPASSSSPSNQTHFHSDIDSPDATSNLCASIENGIATADLPKNLYSNLIHLVDSCKMPVKSLWTLRLLSLKQNKSTGRFAYDRNCSFIDTFRWLFNNQHHFVFETQDGLPSIHEYRRVKKMMRISAHSVDSSNRTPHFSDIVKHEMQYLVALDTIQMLQVQIYRHLRDVDVPTSWSSIDPQYMSAEYRAVKGRELVLDDDDDDEAHPSDLQSTTSSVMSSSLPQVPVPKILEPCCRLTEQKWNDEGTFYSKPKEISSALEPRLPPEPSQQWRTLVGKNDSHALFYALLRDPLMCDLNANQLLSDAPWLGYAGYAEEGIATYLYKRPLQSIFRHFVKCAKRNQYASYSAKISNSRRQLDESITLDLVMLFCWIQDTKQFSTPRFALQMSNCIVFAVESAGYAEEARSEEVKASQFTASEEGASSPVSPSHFTSLRQVRRFLRSRLDQIKYELTLYDCTRGWNWRHFAATPDSVWHDKQTLTPRKKPLSPSLKRHSPLTTHISTPSSSPKNDSGRLENESKASSPKDTKSAQDTIPSQDQNTIPSTATKQHTTKSSSTTSKAKPLLKYTQDAYAALSSKDYITLLARQGQAGDYAQYAKLYQHFCAQHKCKPNSSILKQLKRGSICNENGVIDLSLNLVGDKGIRPLIDLAVLMHQGQSFCARNNHLSNDAIQYLCKNLSKTRRIRHLDLKGNEDMGLFCGQAILEMVKECDWIQDVELERTSIPSRIIDEIQQVLESRFQEGLDVNNGGAV